MLHHLRKSQHCKRPEKAKVVQYNHEDREDCTGYKDCAGHEGHAHHKDCIGHKSQKIKKS